jgi:hypothetical protein
MKCIACGREMLNKGTHLECPNILCDYEEEIVIRKKEISANSQKKMSHVTKQKFHITEISL